MPVVWHDAVARERDVHSFKGLTRTRSNAFVVRLRSRRTIDAVANEIDCGHARTTSFAISKRAARHTT